MAKRPSPSPKIIFDTDADAGTDAPEVDLEPDWDAADVEPAWEADGDVTFDVDLDPGWDLDAPGYEEPDAAALDDDPEPAPARPPGR
ncbi:MAG: hypothetical protein CVU56_06360 [Deltaproteobacteria bacterium HGW-Deltaproteobacteria-14]|jgi:hypothetical protein|nr:MAG: hypothetical protein CVU56_06360 [Deltaproteobacteria bacterium HGW-Deltaproteobacteria-14]